MTTIKLSKEFETYKKHFHKCGIDLLDLDYTLPNYEIIMTTEMYERKPENKTFSKKPVETETKVIDVRQYACYISGIGFFNDRIEKGYTYIGYIVRRMACVNPDRTKKRVTYFSYKKKGDL